MMNGFMKTIYCGYRNIKVMGNNRSVLKSVKTFGAISDKNIIHDEFRHDVFGLDSADLLIIDIDSFGLKKTRFLLFLTSCFSPDLPLVLITENVLSNHEKQHLMSSGRVLDVIGCPQAENTTVIA